MADGKSTVTANVDCTSLIQADLAALLVQLVGDLRERCKRLETMNTAIDSMHSEAARKRDQLQQQVDEQEAQLNRLQGELQRISRAEADVNLQAIGLDEELTKAKTELDKIKAERDAAREQHLTECRKYSAEVERRLALEKQVAEVTAEMENLKKLSTQINPTLLHELIEAFEGCDQATIRQKLLALDGKSFQLSQEVGELPAPEPTREPDRWQDGDTVSSRDVKILPFVCLYRVKRLSCGRVALIGLTGMLSQADWEKHGFTLYRKAIPRLTPRHVPLDEDLPDVSPLTPQQVAEFAALTEPISDSTGADGEGRS
jgi:hypothetical protein